MHEKTAMTTTRVQFIDDTKLNSALFILSKLVPIYSLASALTLVSQINCDIYNC